VFETAQYFVSQYDFNVVNDQDDEGSPGAVPSLRLAMYFFIVCCNKHLLIFPIVLI
jgi:hypothetical protein